MTPLSPDLLKRLAADADRADRAGRPDHARALRQMSAYEGVDVRDHALDLKLHLCVEDSAAAHEVMELVVAADTA